MKTCHFLLLTLVALGWMPLQAQGILTAAPREGRVNLGGAELESAWANTEALVIAVQGEVVRHPGQSVTLRALADDERLYLRLEWPDGEADAEGPVWRRTAAGWEHEMRTDHEVLLALGDPEAERDVWAWSPALTNPVGYAEDRFGVGAAIPVPDAGTAPWRLNASGEPPEVAWAASEWQGPPIPDPDGMVMRSADHLFEGHTEPLGEINPVTGEAWAEGDTVPGVVHVFPTGSQADAEAVGTWHEGRWILELRRRLDTGHDDDIAFQAGETYPLTITFEGTESVSGPVEVELAIPAR